MIAEQPAKKIQKQLRAAGFTPGRKSGSHTFWTGPNGVSISVPDGHRTISPGVVRKIDKAIAASKQ
ncbi:type II toxin-antitoxin system HicA family toxin [Rhodococcus marinonascens]|uniref:type II toxin-antitoxin system HicA family toxin n=1 Tax=Rhodococcus marinonascens TaxID=38311 RepID=UPI00093370A4|nr:type II toxin-antitoxin system HicA family toxin [Rhodococcus marinonascens]